MAELVASGGALNGNGVGAYAGAHVGTHAGTSNGRHPVDLASSAEGLPAIAITCFGVFRVAVDGHPVDLGALKPRPRAVLRLLALNAGRPVHREVIQDALWPDADAETGARSLHVAVSQLRRELDPKGERSSSGGPGLLQRDGDAYRLMVAPGSRVDVLEFDAAVADGRAARARGEREMAVRAYRHALASYAGDLLPEDGPADWVVPARERVRADYVDAARSLAELIVDEVPVEAAAVCTSALAIDPYHDPLWRLLVAARERSGDVAAASSARAGYQRMLTELGVPKTELA